MDEIQKQILLQLNALEVVHRIKLPLAIESGSRAWGFASPTPTAIAGFRAQYRDIVLRCCLQDIRYNTQTEGAKGYYLYSAIVALGEKETFWGIIIENFQKRLSHRIFPTAFRYSSQVHI